MKEKNRFIIVNLIKSSALYGVKGSTLRFSTREIANEVAVQFFEKTENFIVVEIFD